MHHFVHRFAGFAMQARRIDIDSLMTGMRIYSKNPMPRGLWFGRHDADLFTHYAVDERGFADVRPADHRNKTATK
ncbi:MAG: hypothetical protein ACI88G_002145 [Woeseiaceae bacterium]